MLRYLLIAVALAGLATAGCGKSVTTEGPVQAPPMVAPSKPSLDKELTQAAGPVAQKLQAGSGWVIVSPADNQQQALKYLVPDKGGWRLQGKPHPIQAGAKVRLEGSLVIAEGQRGGAPQFAAFAAADPAGLNSVNYYEAKAPEPEVKQGHFLLVNKHLNVLWHYADGKLLRTYRVATGRQTAGPSPTWQDFKTNFFTPEGTFSLTRFVENPPYFAVKPGDQNRPGGDPENPLGTRWMGFPVLNGDGANVWGIHGTNEPDKIGTWASDGCIRMHTAEAEALFAALRGSSATLRIVGK